MKKAYFAATIGLLMGVGSGCSLINSLDSVKPQNDENDGGNGAKGGKGGGKGSGGRSGAGGTTGSSGSGGASGKGGTTASAGRDSGVAGMDASAGGMPTTDSGAGGTTGGGQDSGAGGTDAGGNFTPGGPNGAIVAYDPDSTTLWVLNPTNGNLVSATLSERVLAIVNDPATDYWYIFRQPGKVTDPAVLHVEQLNTTTGQWKTVGTPIVMPNPAMPAIGVLNQRLAYLSTPNPAAPNPATSGLTVLDTTKPDAVAAILKSRSINDTGGKLALTARANALLPGGTVTIALEQTAPCDTAGCKVSVIGETVNATTLVKEDLTTSMVGYVNPTGGNMAFASAQGSTMGAFDLVVMPPATLTGAPPSMCTPNSMVNGTAALLDSSHAMIGSGFSFDIDNLRVNAAVFDPCHNIAFATSLLYDTAIWAIPMTTGGKSLKLCSTIGGGTLLYEPYTKGILRATADDKFELYDFDATDPANPGMRARNIKLPVTFTNKGAVLAVRGLKDVCK
jgi:hypothetical protein